MTKQKRTIGQEINKRVQEGFKLYEYFKNDKEFSNIAFKLAMHDYVLEKIISTRVVEQLEKLLKSEEAKRGG